MTIESDYKPFEWLKGSNVSTPPQGGYPKVLLKLNAEGRAPVVAATSSAKTFATEILDRMLLPPEFDLSFTLSVTALPRVVAHTQLCTEMALIDSLFPGAQPQDLWISHRGDWERSECHLRDKYLYYIFVSAVHVQPQ